MKGEEKQVKKAVEALGKEEGKEGTALGDKYLEILTTICTTGKIPTDALGFSKERMENIYSQAYLLYNTGMYVEASQMFRLLMVLNPTDPKNYLGLAACLHMRKEYANAAQVYIACGILDMTNPIYPFHASDCYIQMRDRISALLVLELAVERAANQPQYQVLKERALLTIDSLKKELAEEQSEKA